MTDPAGVPDVRGMTPARDLRDALVNDWADYEFAGLEDYGPTIEARIDAIIEAAKAEARAESEAQVDVERLAAALHKGGWVMAKGGCTQTRYATYPMPDEHIDWKSCEWSMEHRAMAGSIAREYAALEAPAPDPRGETER